MAVVNVVKQTRWYRKIHRWIASLLFIFFIIISITGLLLGWKKNSNGYLLADSHIGTTTEISQWLSFDSLHTIAVQTLNDSISRDISEIVDRIDARPEKGMVKFVFKADYWAIQLDAATGKVLHIERRRSDLIENIHDGSFIDKLLNINGLFKLSYTTIIGGALIMLTITGFWLWYNPKRIRKKKPTAMSQKPST